MVTYTTIILQFNEQGEKTGWTYIEIPADVAQQLKPDNKRSFRVRGTLDSFAISGVALMPMGGGVFIMAINADMRKGIRKHRGAMLQVSLEEDTNYQVLMPDDLKECFDYEPEALVFFNTLAKSHRNYFIKWIDSAKTETTRTNRIAATINAMIVKWDYGQMIRAMKKS